MAEKIAAPGVVEEAARLCRCPERLQDYPERGFQAGELAAVVLFAQNYAPVRKTERFKTLARNFGLVDY